MFLNYLKLSLRLMARSPFFTFINVAGLSIGFAVFFILWPFSQAELKSDQDIPDHERIARLMLDWRWTDDGGKSWGQLNFAHMFLHVSNEMKDHEQVEDVTRYIPQHFFWNDNSPGLKSELALTLDQNDQFMLPLLKDAAICADRNFITFFGIPLMQGNPSTALNLSESVVLSERMAQRIFQGQALGQLVKVNGKSFEVTGVFKNRPANSHLQFDLIFSNAAQLTNWNTLGSTSQTWGYHYLKMKHSPEGLAGLLNENKDRLIGYYLEKNKHILIDFLAQPLRQVAFNPNSLEPFRPKSKFTLTILSIVSMVVLIMAWINYINLTVSRTRSRFKEIATRKVSGAMLPDLWFQFICQSAVINLLAAMIGITLVQLVHEPFADFFSITIPELSLWEENTFLFFALVLLSGIIVTATYPAWITHKNTTHQLLTKNIPSKKRITTTLFTTAQYITALTLIAWIFVMSSQLNFILDQDLGIDKENVVVIESPIIGLEENGNEKMLTFANETRNKLGTKNLSLSGAVCGEAPFGMPIRRPGNTVYYGLDTHGGVDEKFIPLYKLKLIAGRNFIKDEQGATIILSRMSVQRLGFDTPEHAIGANIEFENPHGEWEPLEVIGVIEDYRVSPYYSSVNNTEAATGRGQCFTYLNKVWNPAVPRRMSLKTSTGEIASVIKEVEQLFHDQFPGNVFIWYFLDEKVNQQYGDQMTIRNQISFFTGLAVMVACLGLLGMISNTVVEKTKEISIRRIMGAGIHHVSGMLLRSTVMQVSVAIGIGIPVAWKFSEQYLQKFTEQIQMQWWHFALPVLMLIMIMLLTITGVLWKVAKSNPVEALKYE